ncbi:MAG: hypothetical protein ACI9VS_003663 [Candidatus Binatia bacterium]|jgi:hypothetical protein
MGFATIQTLLNAAEAGLVRSRLEAAGFHPFIKDINSTLGAPGISEGIHLQVPEEEALEAKKFLEESIGDAPAES